MRTQVHDFKNEKKEEEDKKTKTSKRMKGTEKKTTHLPATVKENSFFLSEPME